VYFQNCFRRMQISFPGQAVQARLLKHFGKCLILHASRCKTFCTCFSV